MKPLVEPIDALDPSELIRTARHAVLAGIGNEGQRRLAAARVAVVGAGGLGSPVILALAAAGVGEIVVIDDDVVDGSNLQRQVLHRIGDTGRPKVDSAVRAAADLSPATRVIPVSERLDADNATRLLDGAHLVVDGSDTFGTREAVAAGADAVGIPVVWGAVQEFAGQATVFWSRPPAGIAPVSLGDLYPAGSTGEPPTCEQVGVLGSLCLQIGGILATEVVKLITGAGEPLLGRVLLIDALRGRQSEIALHARATAVPA
ncbi:HesA/MoeB/ThiF family protein [Microbacterium sp. P06]|uniref:HesA/MoeB/ThiF family protein n=1 Tax=unclassified Microbacterium TaxID=2609290 RepID=UPI003747542D